MWLGDLWCHMHCFDCFIKLIFKVVKTYVALFRSILIIYKNKSIWKILVYEQQASEHYNTLKDIAETLSRDLVNQEIKKKMF